MLVEENRIYRNKNSIPYFSLTGDQKYHSAFEKYGKYTNDRILDGHGIEFTENSQYQGEIHIFRNIVFENGNNGIVIHKSTHADAKVRLEENHVAFNGITSRDEEGREKAAGIVFNSGEETNHIFM